LALALGGNEDAVRAGKVLDYGTSLAGSLGAPGSPNAISVIDAGVTAYGTTADSMASIETIYHAILGTE
jgi:hypothetical protein